MILKFEIIIYTYHTNLRKKGLSFYTALVKDRQQISVPNQLVNIHFLFYYLPFIKIICDAPTAVTVLSTAPKLPGSRILSQITVIGNAFC